jgi:hypothetical protein
MSGQGRRPETPPEALPPGPPAKGEALCNLAIGWVWEEGPLVGFRGKTPP